MEGVRKRLAVGALWTVGGRVFINLIGLASTLVLARLLTPSDFGLVAIGSVMFAIVGGFTELSLSAALIQHEDPRREHYDTAWTLNVIRALAMAAALAILAHPLAAGYNDERLINIMYVLGIAAFVGGVSNPKLVDFRRRLSFKQEMFTGFVNKLVGFIVAALIAFYFRSYWAIVLGSLAAQVAGVILSYILIPYLPRVSLTHWRRLFSFSGWIMLSSGLNAINYRADQLALGAVLGTGTLGHYTVGDNLAALPVRESTQPLANVLFPAFARLHNETPRLRAAYLRAQSLLVAIALPIGVGLAVVALPVVRLVLGPQWEPTALVIGILSTVFALQAFSAPLTPLAMGLGRTRMLFIRDIINLVVRYPLIFAGLFSGGLLGLLLARCVSGVFGIVLDMALARIFVGATVFSQIRSSWRALAATLIMAALVWGLRAMGVSGSTYLELALLVIAGAIAYAGATLALWLSVGRPAGPEQEAMDTLGFLRRRLAGA